MEPKRTIKEYHVSEDAIRDFLGIVENTERITRVELADRGSEGITSHWHFIK